MYKEVLTLKKALITSAVAASLALTGCATGEDSAESGSESGSGGGTESGTEAASEAADAVSEGRAQCIEDARAEASEGLDINPEWQHIAATVDFSEQAETPDLPTTVTDGTGTEAEVADASKIISAGDGISSTLGALGLADNIFAASEDSTAPEGICADELFKFTKETGAEGLLAMDGTLFIGDNTKRHGSIAEQFRNAATDAVVVDDQQSQVDKITATAEYVGLKEAGQKLADQLNEQLAEAKSIVEDANIAGKRVIQVTATGAGGQNSVAGSGTPGVELVTSMGLASVGEESGLRGFSREFSNEGILAADPEIILIAESDLKKWGGEDGMWEAFPTLKDTSAGQEQRVIVMPDAQIRYTSPELGAGAVALAEALAENNS